MQLYFGEVSQKHDTSGCFEYGGKHFYYKMESDEDCIRVQDSVGRYIPFDLAEVKLLQAALDVYMQEEGELAQYLLDKNIELDIIRARSGMIIE